MLLESGATKSTQNETKSIAVTSYVWLNTKIPDCQQVLIQKKQSLAPHPTHRRSRANKTFLENLPIFPFVFLIKKKKRHI